MISSSSVALAAPPKKPAPPAAKAPTENKAYDEGVALFRAGNSEAALAIFKTLTNIESRRGAAFALQKLGRTEEAIAEFELFIAGAPASLDDQVKAARTRVAELKAARKGTIRVVTVPAGAAVEVLDQPALHVTAPADIELPPGKHTVRATLAGNDPAEREVDVAAGAAVQEVRLELVLSKAAGGAGGLLPTPYPGSGGSGSGTPPPKAASAPPSGFERVGAPIVTGALAGVTIGAGVLFGLSALSKKSDYDDRPTSANLADAETDAALSTVSLTAGLVLGAVTVVLLLSKPSGEGAGPKPSAASLRTNGFSVRFF